jgi:hypothetical protein
VSYLSLLDNPRGGLVHDLARFLFCEALMTQSSHFVTVNAFAGPTRPDAAKRTYDFDRRFAHAPRLVLRRSFVQTQEKPSRATIVETIGSVGVRNKTNENA